MKNSLVYYSFLWTLLSPWMKRTLVFMLTSLALTLTLICELQPATLLKIILLYGCFHVFKLYEWYQIVQSITYVYNHTYETHTSSKYFCEKREQSDSYFKLTENIFKIIISEIFKFLVRRSLFLKMERDKTGFLKNKNVHLK